MEKTGAGWLEAWAVALAILVALVAGWEGPGRASTCAGPPARQIESAASTAPSQSELLKDMLSHD
jgi:hypothetical protein